VGSSRVLQTIAALALAAAAIAVATPGTDLAESDPAADQIETCMETGNIDAYVKRPSAPDSLWGQVEVVRNQPDDSGMLRTHGVWLKPFPDDNVVDWRVAEGIVACQITVVFELGSGPGATVETDYVAVSPGKTFGTYRAPAERGRLITFVLLANNPSLAPGLGDMRER
jgi:hypothetical protein